MGVTVLRMTYRATDGFSYNIVENLIHVHDLQAAMLHLLGLDHTRLTYRFQGCDYRLTDVSGEVVHSSRAWRIART
jgi:hypothetical protein